MSVSDMVCKICGAATRSLGSVRGKHLKTDFRLVRCTECGFVSVENPCTDYNLLYDEDYYHGRGADPLVDYAFELEHPSETVRLYEWRGIVESITELCDGILQGHQWLDYGCGAGGLVRYVERNTGARCVGFDIGGFVDRARGAGVPILNQEDLRTNFFDIVTMIEVLEHVCDPLSVLRCISSLLKPGGILFLTTGIAPWDDGKFLDWRYVVPELHVSFFTLESMQRAMETSGLIPEQCSRRGWTDIIRFKVLKNLGVRKRGLLEKALPWSAISRVADWQYQVFGHPIGRKAHTPI